MARRLLDCVTHTDLQLSHHRAFWEAVESKLPPGSLANDGELGSIWLAAVPPKESLWLQSALKLIQEFEGCKLQAYQCPAGIWTIGWGSTVINGKPVGPGDSISQTRADALLAEHVSGAARDLFRLIPEAKTFKPHQQAALVSWLYNVGAGAVADSTLRKRLAAGEDPVTVARAELPRWNKAGGKELPGLVRRRAAEVALFAGVKLQQDPPPPPPPLPRYGNPLSVPWYSQLDSATDQAARMCFSSSCAMLLEWLQPGSLPGANGDDVYLKRVAGYGDTTDPAAQIKALASYGVKAQFTQKADWAMLQKQIDAGIPVPCGYLHRGPVSKPSGGGHWLIVVGYDKTHLIVHDPFGEADLVKGATLGGVARFARYSKANFGKRWMVEGPGSGWAVIASR